MILCLPYFDIFQALWYFLVGAGFFLIWQLEFFLAFRKRWWPGLILPLLMPIPGVYLLFEYSSAYPLLDYLIVAGLIFAFYALPYLPCRLLRLIVDKIRTRIHSHSRGLSGKNHLTPR